MKKILYLLILLSACQKMPVYQTRTLFQTVNVGSAPNDHTGDPVRTAFQKQNINWAIQADTNTAFRSLFGNIYTKPQARDLIGDSLDALRAAALPAADYVFLQSDTNSHKNPITLDYFNTYNTSGGSGGYEWTSFIVGTTTGAPANTDTSFTIAGFAGDRIKLSRGTTADLHQQSLNETATNLKTGYRYNSAGTVVVRPAWSTGDRAYLETVPSASATKVALAGGESSLLTDLLGGWQLNETSGSVAFDVLSTLNGTITGATVNQAGKFGTSYSFDGTDDYVSMGASTTLRPAGTFSLSFWVYTGSTTQSGLVTNYIARAGPLSYGFSVMMAADGTLEYSLSDGDGSLIVQLTSMGTVNNSAWHNIIVTWSGSAAYLYIDNSQADTDTGTGTIAYDSANRFRLGDRGEGDWPLNGRIDDVYLWDKVLSSGERAVLQTYSYPFE